jgi:hypothetical protein
MSAGGKCARCGWPATHVGLFFQPGTGATRRSRATRRPFMAEELCARHAKSIKEIHRGDVKISRLRMKENSR